MLINSFDSELMALGLLPSDPHSLGKYIASKREQRRLTQNALADLCEISRNEIVRIENGERKQPSLNNLRKIASALSIRYDNLLFLAGYIPRDSNGEQMDVLFHYPGLKSQKQVETVETVISLISEHPELTAEDLDDIIKHLRLLIAARKAE